VSIDVKSNAKHEERTSMGIEMLCRQTHPRLALRVLSRDLKSTQIKRNSLFETNPRLVRPGAGDHLRLLFVPDLAEQELNNKD
jgi:hypothetical protein